MTKEESEEIARAIMRAIQYDNGCVNRGEKEKYPKRHLHAISMACNTFFSNYPHLINDEVIEEFAAGEEMELEEKYDGFEGFVTLDRALNAYFNSL